MNNGPVVFDDDGDVIVKPSTSTSINVDNVDEHTVAQVFLSVHRFLEQQNCLETADKLKEELNKKNLLPCRSDPFDTTGNNIIQNSFSQYRKAHSNVTDLMSAVSRLHQYSESTYPLSNSLKKLRLTQNLPERALTRFTNVPSKNELFDPEFYSPDYDDMSTRDLLRSIKFGKLVPTNHSLLSRKIKTNIKQYTKVMGHISPIYCVIFDRTGEFMITGADDNLIKVWDVRQCLLRYTYRGHFGEISDLAVSSDNCLLASGSNDKTVRVWSLQDGSTKKAFMKHKGSITSVIFPTFFEGNVRYLISSALDCSVCFYRYDAKTFEFEKDPYHFKHKDGGPGKIITACTTIGGKFAAFSDTRKNIYVYHLTSNNVEIISTIKTPHSRPDSLIFANTNLRLLSGGSDGVLKMWDFQCNMWRCTEMKLPDNELPKLPPHHSLIGMSRKNTYSILTMLWTLDDSYAIVTGTDNIIRIWDTKKAKLTASLKGHEKTVFVIRNHPTDPRYFVTAGHDGVIFVWDLYNFTAVNKLINDSYTIPGKNDAILDLCFSPNGLFCSYVDDTGYITFMGIGNNEEAKKVPKQQFFHSDYLPCLNNEQNDTIDANTGIEPNLNNPPTFIQMEGIPHSEEWQRRIPGRAEFLDSPQENLREGDYCAWKKQNIVQKLNETKLNDFVKHAEFMAKEFEKIYEIEKVKIPPKSWIETPKPKKLRRSDQLLENMQQQQQLAANYDESDSDDATYSEGSNRSRTQSEIDTGENDEIEVDENDSDYYEGYHGHDTVFRNVSRRRRRNRGDQQQSQRQSPESNQENRDDRPRRNRRPRRFHSEFYTQNTTRRRRRREMMNRPSTRSNPAPEPIPNQIETNQRQPIRRRRRGRPQIREFDLIPRRSARVHQHIDYSAIERSYEEEEEIYHPIRRSRRSQRQSRSIEQDEDTQDAMPIRRRRLRRQSTSIEQNEDTQDFEAGPSNSASVEEQIEIEEQRLHDEQIEENHELEETEQPTEEINIQRDPESPESQHEQDSDYNEEIEPIISDEENINVDFADKPSTPSESTAASTDQSYNSSQRRRSTRKRKKPRRIVYTSEEDDRPKRRRGNNYQETIASTRPTRRAARNANYADVDSEEEVLVLPRVTRSGRETRSTRRYYR